MVLTPISVQLWRLKPRQKKRGRSKNILWRSNSGSRTRPAMPPKPSSTSSVSSSKPSSISSKKSSPSNSFLSLWTAYSKETPARLKLIDGFLLFLMLTGVTQFLYCVLVSSFPFNAFLAGYVVLSSRNSSDSSTCALNRFASCVGQFVLTASLRSQVNPANKDEFKDVSPERSVAFPFPASRHSVDRCNTEMSHN